MLKKILLILIFFTFALNFANADEKHSQSRGVETDPKAFKILKEKSIDPKTGLPRTLDPNFFTGRTKEAYQVAREIPEILAKMPCFCTCEAFGHENLLDCFIDNHAAEG